MRILPRAALLALSLAVAGGSAPGRAHGQQQPDSNDAEALYAAGLASYRAGALIEARNLFAAAVRTDPKFALAYIGLAQLRPKRHIVVHLADGGAFIVPGADTTDTASLLFRRAFQINPFIEVQTPDLPVKWTGTLQLALHHYHKGDLTRAFNEFGSVIARTRKPGHPEAVPRVSLWYHILCAVQLGRYDDAITDGRLLLDAAQAVTDTNPRFGEQQVADMDFMLAELNRGAGHLGAAEDLYREAARRDLGLYMAHARLAGIHETQGRWEAAITERRRAIDANPTDPSLIYDLGVTLADAHADTEAERVLREALQANPRETRANYVLGVVEARLGKVAEARAALTTFLALSPTRYAVMRDDANRQLAALQQTSP